MKVKIQLSCETYGFARSSEYLFEDTGFTSFWELLSGICDLRERLESKIEKLKIAADPAKSGQKEW